MRLNSKLVEDEKLLTEDGYLEDEKLLTEDGYL